MAVVAIIGLVFFVVEPAPQQTCDGEDCRAAAAAIRYEAALPGRNWDVVITRVSCEYLAPWTGIDIVLTQGDSRCMVSHGTPPELTPASRAKFLFIHSDVTKWDGHDRATVEVSSYLGRPVIPMLSATYVVVRQRGIWTVESRTVPSGPGPL